MTITIISILSGLAILFSMCGLLVAIFACIKVMAMEKSTHQVQYMPADDYKSFQEAVMENEDVFYDKAGHEITDPIEKEKHRQKELLKGFENLMQQE
jgi:hypothetical protein